VGITKPNSRHITITEYEELNESFYFIWEKENITGNSLHLELNIQVLKFHTVSA
jgi:hypothetical protein